MAYWSPIASGLVTFLARLAVYKPALMAAAANQSLQGRGAGGELSLITVQPHRWSARLQQYALYRLHGCQRTAENVPRIGVIHHV